MTFVQSRRHIHGIGSHKRQERIGILEDDPLQEQAVQSKSMRQNLVEVRESVSDNGQGDC
jgi:hypothetical protein